MGQLGQTDEYKGTCNTRWDQQRGSHLASFNRVCVWFPEGLSSTWSSEVQVEVRGRVEQSLLCEASRIYRNLALRGAQCIWKLVIRSVGFMSRCGCGRGRMGSWSWEMRLARWEINLAWMQRAREAREWAGSCFHLIPSAVRNHQKALRGRAEWSHAEICDGSGCCLEDGLRGTFSGAGTPVGGCCRNQRQKAWTR